MARLILIGRGRTAERLAELGGRLGYDEVRVQDDLPADLAASDHLVIAEDDSARGRGLLIEAAGGDVMPGYLGYAAPHAEGWKALVALAAEGLAKERLDAVSAPAGVDVGAEDPDEVAIAVAAELVALRRGRRRPSAGLPIGPSRMRSGPEPRPRRLIRVAPKAPGDGEGGGKGRN